MLAEEYGAAKVLFDETLRRVPSHMRALYNRAVCLQNLHRWKEAIQDFSRVIDGQPKDDRSLYNRAMCFMNLDMAREALADLSRVIAIKPSRAAFQNRSQVRALLGTVRVPPKSATGAGIRWNPAVGVPRPSFTKAVGSKINRPSRRKKDARPAFTYSRPEKARHSRPIFLGRLRPFFNGQVVTHYFLSEVVWANPMPLERSAVPTASTPRMVGRTLTVDGQSKISGCLIAFCA